jgi:hypothetical protein
VETSNRFDFLGEERGLCTEEALRAVLVFIDSSVAGGMERTLIGAQIVFSAFRI